MPSSRSPRESVLGQKDIEEVLKGYGFLVSLRQTRGTEYSLWHTTLITNEYDRLLSLRIKAMQRSLATAAARCLVRALSNAW